MHYIVFTALEGLLKECECHIVCALVFSFYFCHWSAYLSIVMKSRLWTFCSSVYNFFQILHSPFSIEDSWISRDNNHERKSNLLCCQIIGFYTRSWFIMNCAHNIERSGSFNKNHGESSPSAELFRFKSHHIREEIVSNDVENYLIIRMPGNKIKSSQRN